MVSQTDSPTCSYRKVKVTTHPRATDTTHTTISLVLIRSFSTLFSEGPPQKCHHRARQFLYSVRRLEMPGLRWQDGWVGNSIQLLNLRTCVQYLGLTRWRRQRANIHKFSCCACVPHGTPRGRCVLTYVTNAANVRTLLLSAVTVWGGVSHNTLTWCGGSRSRTSGSLQLPFGFGV